MGRLKKKDPRKKKNTNNCLFITAGIIHTLSINSTVLSSHFQSRGTLPFSKEDNLTCMYLKWALKYQSSLPALYICIHTYVARNIHKHKCSYCIQCLTSELRCFPHPSTIIFSFKNHDLVTGAPIEPFQIRKRERDTHRSINP